MRSKTVLSALALLGVAPFASADYLLRSTFDYSINGNTGSAFLRDLEFKEDIGFVGSDDTTSVTTSFFNNATSNANAGTIDYTDPFPYGGVPYLKQSLFFGIMQGLPGDGSPSQKHLVLFMDPTAAANVQNIAFGTVFPTTNEDGLIDAIEYVHNDAHTDAEKVPYYENYIYPFYTAAETAHVGPGGTEGNIEPQGNGPFSIVIFSSGLTIGSGTASAQPVPEPASFAALSVGAVALLRKRRR